MPVSDIPLSFRFGVFFFVGGLIPNPIDIRFQKVSGLGATVSLTIWVMLPTWSYV